MNPGWEMIYCSPTPHLAELVKSVLEHNEITCVIRNMQDSLYKPIGEVEVYVRREDLITAKFILSQNKIE